MDSRKEWRKEEKRKEGRVSEHKGRTIEII